MKNLKMQSKFNNTIIKFKELSEVKKRIIIICLIASFYGVMYGLYSFSKSLGGLLYENINC